MSDMDFPAAMRHVLDRARVARRYWTSTEYLRGGCWDENGQWWVGAILTVDFGLHRRAHDERVEGVAVLYRVRVPGSPNGLASLNMSWVPDLDDALATDWYVVTP